MTEIQVGIQAVVTARKKPWLILLGKRRGIFGDGQWALPGGHLEFGESFEAATKRELMEETGIAAGMIEYLTSVNTPYTRKGVGTHYIQIGMQVLDYTGKPRNLEPQRCAAISWFSLQDPLPGPLFAPSAPFIELARRRWQSQELTDAPPPRLSLYLCCMGSGKDMDRYVSYDLLTNGPMLIIRFGRRNEKSRPIRVYTPPALDQGLEFLRKEISRRLAHGYELYDVKGSVSVDMAHSIFPEGTVAFRSVGQREALSSDGERKESLLNQHKIPEDIRVEIHPPRGQLTLFDDFTEES